MKEKVFPGGSKMKAKLNIMKKKFAEILKDESAQGATEYILLIVVISLFLN